MENDIKEVFNWESSVDSQLGFEFIDEEGDLEGTNKAENSVANSETDDTADSEEKPFDPEKIRIDQQMLSLKYVYELFGDGLLKLDPDFQRDYVWNKNRKKSLLIESLILKIPIPAFYFYENSDGTFLIIDGQQRLHTIFDFIEGKFSLNGLEYLGDKYNYKYFEDLEPKYKQRIYRTQLAVNVLDNRSPKKVIYDIFRRINTGGIPLAPQEMRNAICSESTREFLKQGAKSQAFQSATRNKVNELRMDAQELFLRFLILYKRYDYNNHKLCKLKPSKIKMLMDIEINSIENYSEEEKAEILLAYEKSMQRCKELFGQYAFVKIKLGEDEKIVAEKDLINRPLFTAFAVLLADPSIPDKSLQCYQQQALKALAKSLENIDYKNSISMATGDERSITMNLMKSREVIEECLKM